MSLETVQQTVAVFRKRCQPSATDENGEGEEQEEDEEEEEEDRAGLKFADRLGSLLVFISADQRNLYVQRMVHKCCVDACRNIKSRNLVFHRFPVVDPERLRQWLFALDMDVNTPLYVINKLFVCHKHFEPDDYYDHRHSPDEPTRRGRLLKTTAVPSQFRHARTCETGDPTASVIYLDQLVSVAHFGRRIRNQ